MHTKIAVSPELIQRIKQLLASAGAGAKRIFQGFLKRNPQTAQNARTLVDDLYNTYNPKSRDLVKNFLGERLNAISNSSMMTMLPKRYQKYLNNAFKGEAKYYGNKIDKGLQKFNEKAYSKMKNILTPDEQLAGIKVGFLKRASEYGFSEQQALKLLKSASPETANMSTGAQTYVQAGNNPIRPVAPAPPMGVPAVSLASLDSRNRKPVLPAVKQQPVQVARPHLDEAMVQPGQRAFNNIR
jgi:hypothetical protein